MKRSFFESLERTVLRWINVDRWLPLQIDITNACNLRCVHCYHPHHRNRNALGLSDWKTIIDEYLELCAKLRYRPTIVICGGEPLLSPILFPIVEYIRSKSTLGSLNHSLIPVSILTNGTLLSSALALRLKALKQVSLQLSLDGPDAESHEAIRGVGQFARLKQAVDICHAQGLEFHFLAVLTHQNASRISDFFELAREWGVPFMGFTRFIALGHGKVAKTVGSQSPLAPQELKRAYEHILAESARTGVRTNTGLPLMHLLHPALGGSGRFWEALVVDYQGNLMASSRSRLVLGDVLTQGLENLFLRHPLMKKLRAGEIAGCGNCKHLRRCGGDRNAAYAETGDFLGRDPGCWQMETVAPQPTTKSIPSYPQHFQEMNHEIQRT